MKSYLLDTHIFIWAYSKPEKIGKRIRRTLENPSNIKYLSAVSLIEISQLLENKPKDLDIKIPLATYLNQALTELKVQILAITPEHSQRFYEIQPLENHKDPFDRTIIAQAASTGFVILSDDSKFPHYPVEVISNRD
jgi:PIN domain nuclease of toxin-antitoxin system